MANTKILPLILLLVYCLTTLAIEYDDKMKKFCEQYGIQSFPLKTDESESKIDTEMTNDSSLEKKSILIGAKPHLSTPIDPMKDDAVNASNLTDKKDDSISSEEDIDDFTRSGVGLYDGQVVYKDLIRNCEYSIGSYTNVIAKGNSTISLNAPQFREQSNDNAYNSEIKDLDLTLLASISSG